MSSPKETREMLRKRLSSALTSVPPRVRNGSIQLAIHFKDWAVKARKTEANKGASIADLRRALSDYNYFVAGDDSEKAEQQGSGEAGS